MSKFIIDKEINLNDCDYLKTKVYSDNLTSIINDTDKDKVFTIGLFGSWGTGKSSLQALEELPARKITDIFTDINTDKLSKAELEFLEQIAGYIDKNGEITNYRAQLLTNKSDISVKKYFAKFVELGLLEVEGKNKGRKYKINKK